MSAAIEATPAPAPDYAGVKRRQRSTWARGDANMETHPLSRPWRQRVKSAASTAVVVSAFGLFLAWMGGALHEKVRPGELPRVRPSAAGRTVVPVERVRGEETATAVGSVQPKRRTEVASQLLATVLAVRVRPGDRVKPGDTLVTLDDRELAAQQREATASLAAAEADLVTRRAEHDRLRRLRDTGWVTADEHGKVDGAFRVAEAQVARAKETIARLAVQLAHTRIAASGTGLVADRFVDPGDLAAPGKALLIVYDPDDLDLHADVPEKLAAAVPVGTEVAVRIDAAGVTARGTVREVVPQARPASRSVLVKVKLPTAFGNRLLPGMYGRIEVPVGTADRLWLPRAAIRQVGQLDVVEVVNPDDTLSRRFVRVGAEIRGKIEILSGLVFGDRVALPTEVGQ
jgi:membrane fusion protein, multidrug efflux system